MDEKQKNVQTFSGIKIQIYLLILYAITSVTYAYFNISIIADEFIIYMLRLFTIFTDFGIFLAIGYLIDFKRGVVIGYIYKVLVFLSLQQQHKISVWDFFLKIFGIPLCLMLYYKITLFLIIYVASYIVQVDFEQVQEQKLSQEQNKKLLSQQSKKDKEDKQTQKSIQRIKKSLRYHKQNQFYKKLEIFYCVMYHSTCILMLFPIQQYIVDFTKSLELAEKIDFLKHSYNIDMINKQLIWYINLHTILNSIAFFLIILIAQFKIKTKYPQLIKKYILQIPIKFVIIQTFSLIILLAILYFKPISDSIEQLKEKSLIHIVNLQIFSMAYLLHILLSLFITFILIRLYLGQVYYMNNLVSKKYDFYKINSSYGDQNQNLDYLLYETCTQNDLNKVRHFIIDKKQLIARHKLKRYAEQQKLKHYVNQQTVLQIQSLFDDYLILDLWNKFSRFIAIIIFYLTLLIFVISLNVNDTYLVNQDKFFDHVPALLLLFGLGLIYKYESSVNVFYPQIIIKIYQKITQFLVDRKAFIVVRLIHFYAIIFTIWIYRIFSELCLPTHETTIQNVKLKIEQFYLSAQVKRNDLLSSLLQGWAQYFQAHSSECDYSLKELLIDSFMLILLITQIFTLRYFYVKNNAKWDPMLMVLKIITPFYLLYVFVINMQCVQWDRSLFAIFLTIGIVFMVNNQTQLQRGIKRDQQGNFQRY